MPAVPDLAALQERAATLVDAARRAGADASDALATASRALSVQIRDGALEENQSSETDTLGLRVFLGQRSAIVATSATDPALFPALAERALAMARAAPEDRFAGLADADRLGSGPPGLDLVDLTAFSPQDLADRARAGEAAALAVPGVTRCAEAGAWQGADGAVLVTSHGFAGAYARTGFSVSVTAIAGEGTGMQRDYDYSQRVHAADLDTAEAIGTSAGARAVAALQPRKPPTGRVPVVFDRRVASSLVGLLASAVNGSGIARKTSFLRDKLGQRLFPAGVRISDDPRKPRGLRSRPFDAEGVATRPLALVEDGVLASWLLDSATARELGLASTGHAQRGAGGTPHPGASNLTLHPGPPSRAALLSDLGTGLLVTQLIGHGANLVSGDYSQGCFGFWFEDGVPVYPVAEATIAGHLSDIFAALTPADDLEDRAAVNAPSVYAGELTVAGR